MHYRPRANFFYPQNSNLKSMCLLNSGSGQMKPNGFLCVTDKGLFGIIQSTIVSTIRQIFYLSFAEIYYGPSSYQDIENITTHKYTRQTEHTKRCQYTAPLVHCSRGIARHTFYAQNRDGRPVCSELLYSW